LNKIDRKIGSRRTYSKPRVERVIIDNSISLVMMTLIPGDPPPRGGGGKGGSSSPDQNPFASPFQDKPFS
jgi:hypothetical protein